jgi:hypothetical protein
MTRFVINLYSDPNLCIVVDIPIVVHPVQVIVPKKARALELRRTGCEVQR